MLLDIYTVREFTGSHNDRSVRDPAFFSKKDIPYGTGSTSLLYSGWYVQSHEAALDTTQLLQNRNEKRYRYRLL